MSRNFFVSAIVGLFIFVSAAVTFIIANTQVLPVNPASQLGQAIGQPECNDGIDNDGDGLVDWQYDLGCYHATDVTEGGIATGEQDNGWTVFEPSVDTRIIYVSSSEGSDANDGLSPSSPKQTVAAGLSAIRREYPDWLLFKRGDVWQDQKLGLSATGRSAAEPQVYASYGDSTVRPRFEHTNTTWLLNHGGSCEGSDPLCAYVAIVGLHVKNASKDPNDPDFSPLTNSGSNVSILGGGGNYLFEDNKFEFGQFNIQNAALSLGMPYVLRRNVFANNYSLDSHAQHLFIGNDGNSPLLIEENVFYHGGWSNDFRFAAEPGTSDSAVWAGVSDGQFDLTLEGNDYSIDNVTFVGVGTMAAVAQRLEDAINIVIAPNTVEVNWSDGGVFYLVTDDYESDPDYAITPYTGAALGTELANQTYLIAKFGVPESTIFNRNLYLNGRGVTTVRGNVIADSASGMQLRQGGIVEHNLFLRSAYQYNISGDTRYNVQLGSKDIDTQPQGGGYTVQLSALGVLPYVKYHHNVVAHNEFGTDNIRGMRLTVDNGDPAADLPVSIYNNIIYDWRDGDDSSAGLGFHMFDIPSVSTDIQFFDNQIQQPVAGHIIYDQSNEADRVTFSGNSYYSANDMNDWFRISNPSVSTTTWFAHTGETDYSLTPINYTDPDRTIATYMVDIGLGGGYSGFISNAVAMSKYNWDTRFMANTVNDYIREGFDMDLPDGVTYESYTPTFSADVTAPILSAATNVQTGQTTSAGSVSTDEDNGTLYWVITTNTTPLSAQQVLAGENASDEAAADSGSQPVNVIGVQNIVGSSLLPDTTYYTHYIQIDTAGNTSAVVHASAFATLAPPDSSNPPNPSDSSNSSNSSSGSSNRSSAEPPSTVLSSVQDAPDTADVPETPAPVVRTQLPSVALFRSNISFNQPTFNSSTDVRNLQQFLNDFAGEALAVTGTYDSASNEAVKRFQRTYRREILDVWNLEEATGYVGITTRLKMNFLLQGQTSQCPVFSEYNGGISPITVSPEIQKTKQILADLDMYTGPLDQVWTPQTHEAMIVFQETFREVMLDPWNITEGTGYKYKTTNKFLNYFAGCDTGAIELEGVGVYEGI